MWSWLQQKLLPSRGSDWGLWETGDCDDYHGYYYEDPANDYDGPGHDYDSSGNDERW